MKEIVNNKILSKEAVIEYQKIYKSIYGIELSCDEAQKQGLNILNLFKIIYKPIPRKMMYKKGKIL